MSNTLQVMINGHRQRPLGTSGLREVKLEVERDGKILTNYLISHFWKIQGDICKSLLLIRQPVRLSHTAILMTETRNRDILDILLHLKTAKDWLSVDIDHSYDRILGTDFTYTDIRTWLPLEHALSLYPAPLSEDVGFFVQYPGLDTLQANPEKPYYYFVTLDQHTFIPVKVKYYNRNSVPIRVFIAHSLISIQGVWTPKQMSAHLVNSTSCSRMTLINMIADISILDEMLDPLVIGNFLKSTNTEVLRYQILAD